MESNAHINDAAAIIDEDSIGTPKSGGDYVSQSDAVNNKDTRSSDVDLSSRRIVYMNDHIANEGFVDNRVITSKYTPANFIPKFLLERFSQVANFYFLLVGAGQIIPEITSTSSVPFQWLVLLIVLSIDAAFAAKEDAARHQADKVMNAKEVSTFMASSDTFEEGEWRNVQVGEIVRVGNYEAVPADLLILAVHELNPEEPTGVCFVETKSLDGETNLKVRQALQCTFHLWSDPSELGFLSGRAVVEKPNPDVNSFVGRYEAEDGTIIPLELKNIALRGTTIRNSAYIYGLVLNTGSDTKIMQSATATPYKQSKILHTVNRGIAILMISMTVFCIGAAIYSLVWVSENRDSAIYLILNDNSGNIPFRTDFVGFLIYCGYFWILIASFVPITLYVSIAIVKGYQTYFMNRDIAMYDEVTDTPALVRNADLNDDLGQITHVFSDKTGTLTANVMDFRKMSINGVSYGRGTTEIGRAAQRRAGRELSQRDLLADEMDSAAMSNVNFIDPVGDFETDRKGSGEQASRIEQFLLHLSICHSVVLEHKDDSDETSFSASSPDELALVSGASYLGYQFADRLNGAVAVIVPSGEKLRYKICEIVEFSSKRKRMTVVAQGPDGKVHIYVKGADNVLWPRLGKSTSEDVKRKTNEDLEKFASEGLRTLVIAMAEWPQDRYEKWSCQYKEALSDYDEVTKYKAGERSRIEDLEDELEDDLTLLGITAIEDRLQDGVPAAISDLSLGGIKIWVLTGDKEETAINIGYACELLNNNMERVVINMQSYPTAYELEQLFITKAEEFAPSVDGVSNRCNSDPGINLGSEPLISHNTVPQHDNDAGKAIVIDGEALAVVLESELLSSLFLEASQHCKTVICCRASPKQKADVVTLFRTKIPSSRTLAIGDGANDVSMIQRAHVGVGISGQEGMQAVNSSDFAIAQFRFLKRLLLVHGHWNYRRMAKLVLYVMYKNIMLYFTLYVLSIVPGGSGTLYNNNLWVNGYNVFYTAVAILVLGVLEQETSEELAEEYPTLYRIGIKGSIFSLSIFNQWFLTALYESTICALIPVILLGKIDSRGNGYSYLNAGAISYCCMIAVSWTKLALNTVTWNYLMHIAVWGSILFFYISVIIISTTFPISISDQTFPYVLSLPEFYLSIALCLVLCLGRDYIWKAYKREFRPEYYHILQEIDVYKLDSKMGKWVPPELKFDIYKTSPELFAQEKDLDNTRLSEEQRRASNASFQRSAEAHRGFAFSTDQFGPIRDLILFPAVAIVNTVKKTIDKTSASDRFKAYLEKKDPCDQEVYEIQRYQVFAKWGSSRPGHLLLTDPPRFTDKTMRFGANEFDLTDWKVDTSFGDPENGNWVYAKTFKQLRNAEFSTSVSAQYSAKILEKFHKLLGRMVRTRRYVRASCPDTKPSLDRPDSAGSINIGEVDVPLVEE